LDRLFERDEAIAAGQESRAEELQAEIHGLLREKEEIEKWAVSDRPSP